MANREDSKIVGERIKKRRTELGLSRTDLAAMVKTRDGKPQSYSKIAQWEEGRSLPQKARRPELADVLQADTLALFGESDEPGTLERLDLVERKIAALIRLQGLDDAVEALLRAERQTKRRKAQAPDR